MFDPSRQPPPAESIIPASDAPGALPPVSSTAAAARRDYADIVRSRHEVEGVMAWVRRRPVLVSLVSILLVVMLLGLAGVGTVVFVRTTTLQQARLAEQQARLAEQQARQQAEQQARLAVQQAQQAAVAERQARAAAEDAAQAERLAKESARKRLEQIEKANEILAAIFRDFDPKMQGKGDQPLPVQLSERLHKAAELLEGDAVGDALTVARLHKALGDAQLHLGFPERAIPPFTKARKVFADNLGPDHPTTMECMENLAEALLDLGKVLLQQKKYGEAETSLREGIDLRVQLKSDTWSTFEARSLLGAALVGQKKYADAEPLLLASYEGMKQRAAQIPAAAKVRLVEAAQRLVDLYEAWDRPEQAALWGKTVAAERAKVPAKSP
jgi:hypothetical protein